MSDDPGDGDSVTSDPCGNYTSPQSSRHTVAAAGPNLSANQPMARVLSTHSECVYHVECEEDNGAIAVLQRKLVLKLDAIEKKMDELLQCAISVGERGKVFAKQSTETPATRLLSQNRNKPRASMWHVRQQSKTLDEPQHRHFPTTLGHVPVAEHVSPAAKRLFEKRVSMAPSFHRPYPLPEAADNDDEVMTQRTMSKGSCASTPTKPHDKDECEEQTSSHLFPTVPSEEQTRPSRLTIIKDNPIPMRSKTSIRSQVKKVRDRGLVAKSIWSFFEDPESSRAAAAYEVAIQPFLTLCVTIPVLHSMNANPLHWSVALAIESSIECLFAIELLLRFVVCPSRRGFFHNPYNVTDVLAVLPLFLRIVVVVHETSDSSIPRWFNHGQHARADNSLRARWVSFVLLGVVPVLRLLKTLRRFQKFRLLISAFATALEALPCLLFTMFIMVFSFSSLIYLVEERENITTTGEAMWLTIATISTVGYGDTVPKTGMGRLIVSVLIISGVMYMAMPLGIIGYAFTEAWANRDHILLCEWFRRNLLQWGYTAQDIPILFEIFDADEDGAVTRVEFMDLITEMNIGISEERALMLFESLDRDNSGGIDAEEFVRELFPANYKELYRKSAEAGMRKSQQGPRLSKASKQTLQSSSNARCSTISTRFSKAGESNAVTTSKVSFANREHDEGAEETPIEKFDSNGSGSS